MFGPILLKFGTEPLITLEKNLKHFFQKYYQLLILSQLCTPCKIGIKSRVDDIVEKNARDVFPLCVDPLFQILAKLDRKCTNSLKIHKISENSNFHVEILSAWPDSYLGSSITGQLLIRCCVGRKFSLYQEVWLQT